MTMYLGENQANTHLLLSMFRVDADGWLEDPSDVLFRILDSTGVTNIYPAPAGTYEDITLTGVYGTGHWYAPGSPAPASWNLTVDTRYIIEFRHRLTAAASWETQRFVFDVVDDLFTTSTRAYISPLEVRANGLDVATLSNARLALLLPMVHEIIERGCQQPFRPVLVDTKVDGNHSGLMPFPIPLIAMEDVYTNDDTAVQDHDLLALYNGRGGISDNRKNPRMKWKERNASYSGGSTPIWERPSDLGRSPKFIAGHRNQRIVGVFGFVEEDWSAPRLINEAAWRLINANCDSGASGGPAVPAGGLLKREKTDLHEVEYMASASAANLETALYADVVVEDIFAMYRRPMIVASPTDFWVV